MTLQSFCIELAAATTLTNGVRGERPPERVERASAGESRGGLKVAPTQVAFGPPGRSGKMATPLSDKRSVVRRNATRRGRIAFVALAMIWGATCKRAPPPSACLQFSPDLMPDLAGGLIRKDFRMANAWAIKSDRTIDSSGVKFPAYFLSADIVAPSGESVPGTWVTTEITKPGLIYSVSPQARKYTKWAQVGDSATAGISMETKGAKESISCVLNGRASSARGGVLPKATTP